MTPYELGLVAGSGLAGFLLAALVFSAVGYVSPDYQAISGENFFLIVLICASSLAIVLFTTLNV